MTTMILIQCSAKTSSKGMPARLFDALCRPWILSLRYQTDPVNSTENFDWASGMGFLFFVSPQAMP